MRRVVVTGIGLLAPQGSDPDTFFTGLAEGRSAVRRLATPFAEKLAARLVAEVEFDPAVRLPGRRLSALDRTTQFSLAVAREALEASGLPADEVLRERTGVYWGTGMGSAHGLEATLTGLLTTPGFRPDPATVVRNMNNAAAAQISMDCGLRGPQITYSTACSSSAVAIGEAFHAIRFGLADAAVAGGAESLFTWSVLSSWQALQTLAIEDADDPSASCRPFSRDRTGFVLGEGAAALVLEEAEGARRRGAVIHGEIAGYGCTSDARHITKPDVDGQARAMRAALAEAGLAPEAIGYVNAHGTATRVGDVVETQAIKQVFGAHAATLPVSSTKSMHGHLLGGAGAVESVATLLAMRHRVAPPTAHLRAPDPECDLDYVPNRPRAGIAMRAAMSNSFAFGGGNAVLVFRAHD